MAAEPATSSGATNSSISENAAEMLMLTTNVTTPGAVNTARFSDGDCDGEAACDALGATSTNAPIRDEFLVEM